MNRVLISIFPTLHRAKQTMDEFCRKCPSLVSKTQAHPYRITLVNGDIWFFRSEGVCIKREDLESWATPHINDLFED